MGRFLKLISVPGILISLITNVAAQTGKSGQQTFLFSRIDSANRSYINTAYPPFELALLDGKSINNSIFEGKVTVLNFWFEDCMPCREEFPNLDAAYHDNMGNPKFQLIGITFDPKENAARVVKQFDLAFPIGLTGSIEKSQEMNFHNGFPTTIIIGADGRVVYVKLGKINYSRDTNIPNNIYPILKKYLN